MDRPHRQEALDAVRGIAILLVLLFHFDRATGVAALDAALAPFRIAGWAGVDLFFVLSGFLVGRIVLTEVAATGRLDRRRFLVRRAFRLLPVLLLYLAVLALIGFNANGLWPVLLHVQNYFNAAPNHLWSLAVEEHFYLIAAFALPWLARTGGLRRILIALGIAIVVAGTLRIVALHLGIPPRYAQWQTQFRIDAPAAGVLLAAVAVHRPDWLAAARRFRLALIAAAMLGFALLASDPGDALRWGPGLTLAWLSAAALVVAASDTALPASLAGPAGALAALGRIAYPLYVWHSSIGQAAAGLLAPLGAHSPTVFVAVEIAASIAVAALIHRAVERPFLQLRDHVRWPRRPAIVPATSLG